MGNVQDYLTWRGDLSFAQSSFNEVDSLILTELTYMDFSEVVPAPGGGSLPFSEVCRLCFEKRPYAKNALGLLLPDEIQDLLRQAGASVRFASVQVSGYVNEIDEEAEKQFAALTFDVTENLRYVSFRGTDDTLVGWKEDCNMSFCFPVPSHVAAQAYWTRAAAERPEAELIVGGHSKGGNLAMYAAAFGPEAALERTRLVYNHDGPGFPTPDIAGKVYRRLGDKLLNSIPEASIVGLLMEFRDQFRIVRSNAKGPMQHNGLSWQVKGPSFDVLTEEPKAVKRKKRTLHAWLREMDLERRKEMVENLFALRKNVEAKTLLELFKNPTQTIPALFASYDKETREVLRTSFKLLFREEQSAFQQALKEDQKDFKETISENIQGVLGSLRSSKKE